MSSLVVMTPNKRRTTVKVTPGKTLQQVLEEACKLQGFDPEKYGLLFHGKPLDLSISYRLSGIPSNATLETKEQDTPKIDAASIKVQVALQTPDGNRNVKTFAQTATLWDLVKTFDEENHSNILGRLEGSELYPACQYLTQEFVGEHLLKTTTLRSMGIKGKVLIRFLCKELGADKAAALKTAAEESEAKERRLEEIFNQKKVENDERERFEADRAKRHEERRALEEAEAAKLIEKNESSIRASRDEPNPAQIKEENPPSSSAGVSEPPATNPRLAALQSMLGQVDNSIVSGGEMPWDFDLGANRDDGDRRAAAANAQIKERAKEISSVLGFSDFKFPEATKGKDLRPFQTESVIESPVMSESAPKKFCLDRETVIYARDETNLSGAVAQSAGEIQDDFFELSAQDVRRMQQLLSEEIRNEQNRAFVPEAAIRQKNQMRKREAWKKTVVRIVFPNKDVLQSGFASTEPLENVYEHVRASLNCKLNIGPNDFVLFEPPSMRLETREKTLLELNLSPAVTLFFRLNRGKFDPESGSIFEDKVSGKRVDANEAQDVAKNILSENEVYTPWRPTVSEKEPESASRAGGSSSASNYSRVSQPSKPSASSGPRWLKGPKK